MAPFGVHVLFTLMLLVGGGLACNWSSGPHRVRVRGWFRPFRIRFTYTYHFSSNPTQQQETNMLFQLCDADSSDDVTLDELADCFSQGQAEFQPAEFIRNLDSDGDGKLNRQEFSIIKINIAGAVGCYQRMLMLCGTMFLTYSRTREADGNLVCGALQEYVTCVANTSQTCDAPEMKSFKHSLATMVSSGMEDGVDCPDINLSALGETPEYTELSCTKGAVLQCDIRLIKNVHGGMEACRALAAYSMCLDMSTEECEDDVTDAAKSGSRALIAAYLGNNMCEH